jgi:hypothetical protein
MPLGEEGGGEVSAFILEALQTTILAHVVSILLHRAVISQERQSIFSWPRKKIAKSVDSRLRTFGDSGVVCLAARLARKAETLDSRRRYERSNDFGADVRRPVHYPDFPFS